MSLKGAPNLGQSVNREASHCLESCTQGIIQSVLAQTVDAGANFDDRGVKCGKVELAMAVFLPPLRLHDERVGKRVLQRWARLLECMTLLVLLPHPIRRPSSLKAI